MVFGYISLMKSKISKRFILVKLIFFSIYSFFLLDVVNKDLSNMQTLLVEKENELSELSLKCQEFQANTEESERRLVELNNELFKLRSKCRDSDYILSKKEEAITDLQQQLESRTSLDKDSIIAECEANLILQEKTTSVMITQLKEELDKNEKDKNECLAEMERKLVIVDKERQKLTTGNF